MEKISPYAEALVLVTKAFDLHGIVGKTKMIWA